MAIVFELAKQGANIVIDYVEVPPGDKWSMRINIDNQDSNQTSRLRTHA